MSIAPSRVLVKRRRSEDPLAALVLEERTAKRERTNVQYHLESVSGESNGVSRSNNAGAQVVPSAPRHFELSVPSRKRNADTAGLMPTFVEKRWKGESTVDGTNGPNTKLVESPPLTPLKRPGTKALRKDRMVEQSTPNRSAQAPPNELADAMHKFALEEAAAEEAERSANVQAMPKPRLLVRPKRSVRRLKDRQTPSTTVNGAQASLPRQVTDIDEEMSDDEGFVYDLYIRYEQGTKPIGTDLTSPAGQPIGYLIIKEEDEPLWETFLEEEEEDRFDTDDEDENAEDYYGADYPEDEVASDDELGQGAYGYRHGGSEDEQWDSETGTFSDEEDAMRNPWRKAPWLKTGGRVGGDDGDDEE